MVDLTDNHEFQLWADGDEQWEHRTDMETLDVAVSLKRPRPPDETEETPKDGAVFLDTSTGEIYLADGSSWGSPRWDLGDIGSGGGGDSDHTSVEGIDNTGTHVGPPHQGGYHENDGYWGIVFSADPELPINSVVIDMDGANATASEATIALYEAQTTSAGDANQDQPVVPDGMTESEALLDSVTTSVTDGPKRVTLGAETPTNPATGEFFLGVESSGTPFRRIIDWTGWSDQTYDQISLLYSGRWNNTTSGDFSANYYRCFDIEIGDGARVTAPWSTDVDEIYMRPRDPAEEFDDVSPRSIWIDTSQ